MLEAYGVIPSRNSKQQEREKTTNKLFNNGYPKMFPCGAFLHCINCCELRACNCRESTVWWDIGLPGHVQTTPTVISIAAPLDLVSVVDFVAALRASYTSRNSSSSRGEKFIITEAPPSPKVPSACLCKA
ncbi:hypothetical protein CFP56_013594 [Quercus suber]|uniref:Uncharacterized protein n=1 Tax=Quercus suber TaxID=58331 RepID=A0AAW0KVB6_QUESU